MSYWREDFAPAINRGVFVCMNDSSQPTTAKDSHVNFNVNDVELVQRFSGPRFDASVRQTSARPEHPSPRSIGRPPNVRQTDATSNELQWPVNEQPLSSMMREERLFEWSGRELNHPRTANRNESLNG